PEHVGRVHWDSGLAVLGQMLAGFTNFDAMIPAFFNLMLVGCLLAMVFERSGSILFPIGLHAGFVFWVKTLNFVTDPVKGEVSAFWGSDKVIDGWATSLALVLIFLLLERTLPPRKVVST
ncbi:MAG: CPBP family glutamic-type intramembrane protease, partial [Limisphaerales bacterium]